MNRDEALSLIKSKVLKHMLAVEACMSALSKYFGEMEKHWAQVGLLHDLDYDDQHGLVAAKILKEKGDDKEIIDAIEAHPGHKERTSPMSKSLYAVDPLTGLIVSATLMHPEKKLTAVDTQFVLNRFKEKRFAAGANRRQIESCQDINLSLEEFIRICLSAMQGISEELEL